MFPTFEFIEKEVNKWKIYENIEYGFKIKYPQDWLRRDIEDVESLVNIILTGPDGGIELRLILHLNPKHYTTETWAQISIDSSYVPYWHTDYIVHEVKETYMVAGYILGPSFTRLIVWGNIPLDFKAETWPTGRTEKAIFFPYREGIFEIKGIFLEELRDQYEPLFNQMLSTLEFLE